jgi:hypothetical protein
LTQDRRMSWIKNAKKNLLPLSREQQKFALALREWHYTGNTYDLEEPIENCELCEHRDIRYPFEIANRLLVGSECIHKFEIGAIDESGALRDTEHSRRKVDKDRRTLIADARKRRVISTFVQLSTLDKDFKIECSSTILVLLLSNNGTWTSKMLATQWLALKERA